jgi:conjugal transfer pilus assembly protein TraK
MRRSVHHGAIAAIALSMTATAMAEVDLPVVPVQVVSSTQPTAPDTPTRPTNAAWQGFSADGAQPQTLLNVRPGVNEIAVVAIGHINRIVTPFESPVVWTASSADITTRENVLYLMPENETPVTMYVTDSGDESVAISLTLAPRRVPPRELRLQFDETAMLAAPIRSARARHWERAQPYIETLRMLFRELAVGNMPPGYTVRDVRDGDYVPRCYRPAESVSFHFAPGQLVMGNDLEVLVGTVINRGEAPVELQEIWCADHGVAAVAYWPAVVLSRGEVTEVFVAIRKDDGETGPTHRARPTLIDGGVR